MKHITQTNGNTKNGIKGSRLRFWNDLGEMVGEMIVPKHNAKKYCINCPDGKYGKEYLRLLEIATTKQ